jgi:UDP-N-acetylmuramoyl-tripeptide--D-alanyl-D-alanine ligase
MCTDAGAHVLATENSENGSIGLPLTLLRLKENHDAAIIEVGIQKPGEMDILIAILQKVKLSVITTILLAHEEHFCNKETVILEKTKLQLITEEKIIVPEEIKSYIHPRLYTILLGCSEKSDYQYQSHPMNISIFNAKTQKEFSVQSIYHTGYHHCLANAFACGLELGYRPKDIIHSLETFKRVPGRFSIHTLQNGGIIINDAYNAAHLTVMEKSIESFIFFPTNKKKVLVIGDMLEQGSSEVHNHTTIFEKVNSLENFFELAFFVGPRFKQNEAKNNNNKIQFANSIDEIKDTINTLCNTNHCMFFKSSRSMALFNYVTNYLNNNEK